MPILKKRRKTKAASATKELDIISKRIEDKKEEVTLEQYEKVLEYYRCYPHLFENSKKRVYTLLRSVLEVFFIMKRNFYSGRRTSEEYRSYPDWAVVDFFKNESNVSRFELLKNSFQTLVTKDQHSLLTAFQNLFSSFEKNSGGVNRKILLFLLLKFGVGSTFLAKFAGVTTGYLRKLKKRVTKNEITKFYRRFELSGRKKMFSSEEMEIVKKVFQLYCPGNSYSKTDKFFRQICGDKELFEKYKKYIVLYNNNKCILDPGIVQIKERCYNVFLYWKRMFKVKKTIQRDIDYNCGYCFEHWQLERDIVLHTTKINTKKHLKKMLLESDNSETFLEACKDIDEELTKLEMEMEEKKKRLKEVEKHKILVKTQRERVEKIEKTLKKDQVLIFFDYTKYNYLCHDLCFVVVYRDHKGILQRKYVHYLHSKWDSTGCKVPNDARYTITTFKKFFSYLRNEIWTSVRDKIEFSENGESYPEWKEVYLASDGGPHFINAAF